MNRRSFLKNGSAAGLAVPAVAAQGRPVSANDRIGVAVVGCGGMGRNDLIDFQKNSEVDIVAVCDVYGGNLERARQLTGGKAQAYGDYRRVLERKDVAAVVVATPDHWHPLITIDACNAGKDVYVEKPISHNVREGRLMVEAARKNNRVVQVGIQQRSGTHFQRAVAAVKAGKIGTVHTACCWNHNSGSAKGVGYPSDAPIPSDLDWDMWLGPAPKVPYNPARRNFRMFWDYAGGQLTNWAVHLIDIVHWALDLEAPLSVTSSGGKYFVDDCSDFLDTQQVLFEYPKFLLQYSTQTHNSYGHNGDPGWKPFGSYGIMMQGTKGTLFVDRAGYEITPQMSAHSEAVAMGSSNAYDDLTGSGMYYTNEGVTERGTTSVQHFPHVRNFLDCIKTRQKPAGDIEIGHRSTSVCLLGNIAQRTGQKILWDAKAEKITNSKEANALLSRQYRAPWKLEGMDHS